MLLDTEAGHWLAGRGNAIDDFLRPAFFTTDDHHGCNIGIADCADQHAKMQIKIFPKLQPTIRVG